MDEETTSQKEITEFQSHMVSVEAEQSLLVTLNLYAKLILSSLSTSDGAAEHLSWISHQTVKLSMFPIERKICSSVLAASTLNFNCLTYLPSSDKGAIVLLSSFLIHTCYPLGPFHILPVNSVSLFFLFPIPMQHSLFNTAYLSRRLLKLTWHVSSYLRFILHART